MAYDYIKRAYAVNPIVGQRVQHTETRKFGVVTREDKGQGQYVQVRFDGQKFSLPCHPKALDYSPQEGRS